MEQTSTEVFMKIENLYEPLLYITEQAVELPILGEKPTLQNHPAEKFFINSMLSYPQIQILYIGYSDGDFYEVLSYTGKEQESLRESTEAPDDARFGILRQFTPVGQDDPVRLWKYLNSEYQTIGSLKQYDFDYDPRLRPWYIKAIESGDTVKTNPYLFSNVNKIGITISKMIDGNVSGVLGVDILMDEMSFFLEQMSLESEGLIFIFNDELHLTAYPLSLTNGNYVNKPNLAQFSDEGIKGFVDYLKENDLEGDLNITLSAGEAQYLVKAKRLPDKYSNNEYLFIAIPTERILSFVGNTALETFLISLIFIALTFPLVYFISGKISQPLKRLEIEAGKIANLDLNGEIQNDNIIKEIYQLSLKMKAMKKGLKSFNKYVPSKLVRRLMESGVEEQIGGTKKEMTFLFSDIQDFTNIAESTDPETLMKHLSCYFEVVSTDIRNSSGTVDKYIGDAVMAFWNAPDDDLNHIVHACEAALNIQKNIDSLNSIWREQGQSPLLTRIGIDTGIAVVGNVGGSERMNYTAIGDTVNAASRLEGVNKLYGTNILIGEVVASHLSEKFLIRPLEKIIVKGKTQSNMLYELMGFTDECEDSQKAFAFHFSNGVKSYYLKEWNEALKSFLMAECIKPDDKILISYLGHCREVISNPPQYEWDGIRVLYRK